MEKAYREDGLLLTVSEAARLLNVKTSMVYRMAKRGELPHVRLGRYLRFPPDISERMIQGGPNPGGGGE